MTNRLQFKAAVSKQHRAAASVAFEYVTRALCLEHVTLVILSAKDWQFPDAVGAAFGPSVAYVKADQSPYKLANTVAHELRHNW